MSTPKTQSLHRRFSLLFFSLFASLFISFWSAPSAQAEAAEDGFRYSLPPTVERETHGFNSGSGWDRSYQCDPNWVMRTIRAWKDQSPTQSYIAGLKVYCREMLESGVLDDTPGLYDESELVDGTRCDGCFDIAKSSKAQASYEHVPVGIQIRYNVVLGDTFIQDVSVLSTTATDVRRHEKETLFDWAVGEDFGDGTRIKTLACSPGFILTGLATRFDTTGKWHGVRATCSRLQSDPTGTLSYSLGAYPPPQMWISGGSPKDPWDGFECEDPGILRTLRVWKDQASSGDYIAGLKVYCRDLQDDGTLDATAGAFTPHELVDGTRCDGCFDIAKSFKTQADYDELPVALEVRMMDDLVNPRIQDVRYYTASAQEVLTGDAGDPEDWAIGSGFGDGTKKKLLRCESGFVIVGLRYDADTQGRIAGLALVCRKLDAEVVP